MKKECKEGKKREKVLNNWLDSDHDFFHHRKKDTLKSQITADRILRSKKNIYRVNNSERQEIEKRKEKKELKRGEKSESNWIVMPVIETNLDLFTFHRSSDRIFDR